MAWLLPAMVQLCRCFGVCRQFKGNASMSFFFADSAAVFDRIVHSDVLGLPHRPNTPKCAQLNALQLVYDLYYSTMRGF